MSICLGGGGYGLEHQQNFRRLLEILEVDINRLQPINHPTQFENIILPDESFFIAGNQKKFTAEYRETIERVRGFALKNRTPTASNKVYYFYGTAQIGEERLAEYFHSKGYAVVSPEKLTFDAQINLLINAESFASTLGSCAHNAVFLRDGTEVILIPRSPNHISEPLNYQEPISQISKTNVNYVDSALSVFETFNGPYCFIVSQQLKNFFGDDFSGYTDDNFKIFLAYIKFSISRGFKINSGAMKYYEPIWREFFPQLKKREDLIKAYDITFK